MSKFLPSHHKCNVWNVDYDFVPDFFPSNPCEWNLDEIIKSSNIEKSDSYFGSGRITRYWEQCPELVNMILSESETTAVKDFLEHRWQADKNYHQCSYHNSRAVATDSESEQSEESSEDDDDDEDEDDDDEVDNEKDDEEADPYSNQDDENNDNLTEENVPNVNENNPNDNDAKTKDESRKRPHGSSGNFLSRSVAKFMKLFSWNNH